MLIQTRRGSELQAFFSSSAGTAHAFWGEVNRKSTLVDLNFGLGSLSAGGRPEYKIPGLGFGLCVSSCGRSSEREARY